MRRGGYPCPWTNIPQPRLPSVGNVLGAADALPSVDQRILENLAAKKLGTILATQMGGTTEIFHRNHENFDILVALDKFLCLEPQTPTFLCLEKVVPS